MHSFSVAFAEAPGAGKAVLARRVEEEAAIVNAQQARLADVRRELAGLAALDAERRVGRAHARTVRRDAGRSRTPSGWCWCRPW